MTAVWDPSKPLPRREFARALRMGLGRARIDVRRHGLAGREDLLVAACLRNPTRDTQVEGPLAQWLLAIAVEGRTLPAVRRAVVAAAVQPIARRRDADQIARILARLALGSDGGARRALLRMVDVQRPHDAFGAAQAIWALGPAGLLRVARSYGRRWRTARHTDLGWLAWVTRDEIGVGRATELLRTAASRNTTIRPFLAAIEAEFRDQRAPEPRPGIDASLDALERYVADGRRRAWTTWARHASPRDREEAWRRLFTEPDVARLRRRLFTWGWRRGQRPPSLDPRLLTLADHPDRRVRVGAVFLLDRFRDERVRALALRRLRDDPKRASAEHVVGMLERNARLADAAAIERALPRGASRETTHSWVMDAHRVAERRRGPAWDAMLLRCYEVSSCRSCRWMLLERLVERGLTSPSILREARWDADDDVRRVAREALRKRQTAKTTRAPGARAARTRAATSAVAP